MSETTNSAGVGDPVAPVTIYAATLDAGSVVVAVSISNLLAEGAVAIDADTYAAAWSKLGRCKLVSGALQDYDPPAAPAATPLAVSKAGLVRALMAKGDWQKAKGLIASNADAQDLWNAYTIISRADPLTQEIIAGMGYSDADVNALMQAAIAA